MIRQTVLIEGATVKTVTCQFFPDELKYYQGIFFKTEFEGFNMQKRTLLLFALMLMLFVFYTTVSLQAMPEVSSGLKHQKELLNSLNE